MPVPTEALSPHLTPETLQSLAGKQTRIADSVSLRYADRSGDKSGILVNAVLGVTRQALKSAIDVLMMVRKGGFCLDAKRIVVYIQARLNVSRLIHSNFVLRILQISSAQSLGGGERHLADLANGLVARGHDLYVALRRRSPLLEELKGVSRENIFTLSLRNSLDAKSARDLSRLVSKYNIQIVHAHMARDYPLAAYAVGRHPGSRLIVTRHVLFRLNRLHRITLSKAARVIAVSKAVALQLRTDNLAPAEKISIVLNGIDTDRFARAKAKFDRRQFLDAWKLPRDSTLVGLVGELSPLKGQEELVRAAVQVIRQYPKTYFIIGGVDHSEGIKHQKRLERLIEELDLTSQVRLIGWLEDLPQLYSALDVFVSASHTESFGLAIAEAMASRTAVVATETEGARELITEGETGLLVPIGDVGALASRILRLLTHENERMRLGVAAQQTARAEFSLERMIAETEKIYEVETQKVARP